MKKMSKPNSEYMASKIEKEGFHYAFIGYSDFEEVEDIEFHNLRLRYIQAVNELGDYMNIDKGFYT